MSPVNNPLFTNHIYRMDQPLNKCFPEPFPGVTLAIMWKYNFRGGQGTEMWLHGDLKTLESKIDCSIVDTRLRNVSNVRTQLIVNTRRMYVSAMRR